MKNVLGLDGVIAEKDIWELIDQDERFNEFVGKCVTHFVHFVISRRDQTKEISEMYQLPIELSCDDRRCVRLTRKDNTNKIYIAMR